MRSTLRSRHTNVRLRNLKKARVNQKLMTIGGAFIVNNYGLVKKMQIYKTNGSAANTERKGVQ